MVLDRPRNNFSVYNVIVYELTTPMFDNENVVSAKSPSGIDDFLPSSWNLLSSRAIARTLRFCTFLMLGTTRPSGVSIAMPIL